MGLWKPHLVESPYLLPVCTRYTGSGASVAPAAALLHPQGIGLRWTCGCARAFESLAAAAIIA